jgi:hypothetical protein
MTNCLDEQLSEVDSGSQCLKRITTDYVSSRINFVLSGLRFDLG